MPKIRWSAKLLTFLEGLYSFKPFIEKYVKPGRDEISPKKSRLIVLDCLVVEGCCFVLNFSFDARFQQASTLNFRAYYSHCLAVS